MKQKINKLKISIEKDASQDAYEKAKKEFISTYTIWIPGYSTGFFGWRSGREEHRPDEAEAKWNALYPEGRRDWLKEWQFEGDELQLMVNKINELVSHLNKLD